jgi:hypothetical protein
MRSVLKALQSEPCRTRDLSENERNTFLDYSHLQRYFPALDQFNIPNTVLSQKNIELSSKYHIDTWISQQNDSPRFWKATRRIVSSDSSESSEPCDVFIKVVHLLNPIDMIKEKYVCPEHPLIPQSEKTWKNTLLKLHSHNNQAYVDAVANFVLSRFRELDLTPHCVLYYGSYTGISNSYPFNISNEYESYRQCRWFWKGMASHSARLTLVHNDPDIKDQESFESFYKEITTCPFENEEDEDLELEPVNLDSLIEDHSDIESVESFTFDTMEDNTDNSTDIIEINKKITKSSCLKNHLEFDSKEELNEIESVSSLDTNESDYDSDDSDDSDETMEADIDICLKIPNMPIIMIVQEAQEGVMDKLLDEDELDGFERGSQGWESRWIAWIFQVISALTFLQSAICFTHNDLHSNNIIWRKTEKKFLYYKAKDGTVWRVPTFGKIFSIIDFGRSIFRLGKHLWVSDDHWPDQDAGEQYNFGPFFDHNKPKVIPNSSFDLCRLSVSLMDGLFDEPPPKKKGKGVSIMSEEGSWKVYETRSPLYNLLWSWTVDDAGRTVYEDKDGDEKYEGFELYIRIAQHVHNAVPKDQLRRPIFQQFIWNNKVSQQEKIYSLGV